MSDFYTRPSSTGRRRSSRSGYNDREAKSHDTGSLFAWTIFILLLVGLVAVCWMGTLYVFGHPEQPLGYAMLRKFKKIEAPKRFIETAAPRGEFLDAKMLLARYNNMTPRQLQKESDELLRNYIRNYENMRERVPYVIGRFTILDTYELTKNDFFTSGVAAVAQDSEAPQVVLEQVFPSDERSEAILYRTLLTGTEIPLQRSQDLAPIIHIERLPDGRLKFTTVPIQYPNYSATQGPGGFALEPPTSLNVEAGLPIFSNARMKEADERYAAFRRKLGRTGRPTAQATPPPASALMPVRPAVTTTGQTPAPPPVAPALPVNTPAPGPTVTFVPPPMASPEPKVLPAIPVNGTPPAPAVAAASATPATVGADVPLKPFMATNQQTSVASTTSGKWQTYKPGQMPKGRLVSINDARTLANANLSAERLYLQGDFNVTAAVGNSAVLRNSAVPNTRVVVQYPAASTPPQTGEQISRSGDRPFLITNVRKTSDGQINIYVREVTSP
jgi:hypothetical protein